MDLCLCGGVGLYRVGRAFYCKKHKHLAIARRKTIQRRILEPRSAAAEATFAEIEGFRRRQENRHSYFKKNRN